MIELHLEWNLAGAPTIEGKDLGEEKKLIVNFIPSPRPSPSRGEGEDLD